MNDSKKSLLIGLGLIILSAVSIISTLVVISDYREATACQAEYNKNYVAALTERQKAADDDRAASRTLAKGNIDMLNTVLNPAATTDQRRASVEQYREIYQDYLKSAEQADITRKLNPLPLIPECAIKE